MSKIRLPWLCTLERPPRTLAPTRKLRQQKDFLGAPSFVRQSTRGLTKVHNYGKYSLLVCTRTRIKYIQYMSLTETISSFCALLTCAYVYWNTYVTTRNIFLAFCPRIVRARCPCAWSFFWYQLWCVQWVWPICSTWFSYFGKLEFIGRENFARAHCVKLEFI